MNRNLLTASAALAAAVILVGVVWLHILPRIERAMAEEFRAQVRATATYTNALAEREILTHLAATDSIRQQIRENPREGEAILRIMLDQEPELLAVRIYAPGVEDELLVHRRGLVVDSTTFTATGWFPWNADTTSAAAIAAPRQDSLLLFTRSRLTVGTHEFVLSTIWEMERVLSFYTTFPADTATLLHVMSPSGIVWKNWRGDSVSLEPRSRMETRFASLPLKLVLAFATDPVITPVRLAVRDAIITGLIVLLIPSVLAFWRNRKA